MKKISIIFITILLLITNFSVIFADETEIDESNDTDTTELNENENSNDLNIDNEIKSIKNEIVDIKSNLKSINNIESNDLVVGDSGLYFDFNYLSSAQLNFYYDNYSSLGYFGKYYYGNNYTIIYQYIDYVEIKNTNLENQYFVICHGYYFLDSNGISTYYSNDLSSVVDISHNSSDSSDYRGRYLVKSNNLYLYSLQPYKINIINNGIGSFSINPNSSPYETLIFYSGQDITISYDDQFNDFIGYYDLNGNLLSNNKDFSVAVNQDMTIIINYNEQNANQNYYIYLIILLSFLILNNLFNGGKLYD